MASELRLETASRRPWLSIVGIGEDGVAGLGSEAQRRVSEAEFVFGGKRHLALAASLIKGEARPWPSPFDTALGDLVALSGRRTCVLASGDPFLHGVGATIARRIAAEEIHVIPAPSAFSLAAARLGWPLAEVEAVSLHGKPIELIRPLLHPSRRVIALTSDESGPQAIAALLSENGFGLSMLTVLEALGGERERIRSTRANRFALDDVAPLNVVAVEVVAGPGARVLPLAHGLSDDLFEHDGQITKREIRALTLSALAPRRGELLWDIGAGAGSVAIEWMLAAPSANAIAIEANTERAARIRRNALSLGVPGLTVVVGSAPAALSGLARPNAIFIGGGGSDEGVLDTATDVLPSGGRLVANAVTIEMETLLLGRHASLGGDLTRIAIWRAAPIGSMQGWRPAMPVTQWSWVKP
ncbi:precorrin-6y C5,15-methyltransferase (decarboxylating) subunit CbiE [Mesorhizobium sp. BAC0120]|uniref:precorrin-6y C5,15-methyltransferase (decarboxylating) subunit CbiE n=1 Tax=Mesorhizobium sp. BAC0120 TaxID=3090670 RepID=UPI00298D14B5|nr:precorrin-6y C5,15-methyltransferase (decarboxylating) subunit CbiE [Mesorhizobium sp. BAC0120]MDW6020552.1 precorrin-6y C5,15-methyltransferase (decarboxylating) subunit CbiE [Mesorhizobium sp. BAC0120]